MNIPKIIFRSSRVFDAKLIRDPNLARPAQEKFDSFFEKIKLGWHEKGSQILEEVSLVTKLVWHEEDTTCYVTWGVNPFSDPLTINLISDIHNITHELIHRILSQRGNNPPVFHQNWDALMQKYKEETQLCRTHVVVHAVHSVRYKKLFGEEALNNNIKHSESHILTIRERGILFSGMVMRI